MRVRTRVCAHTHTVNERKRNEDDIQASLLRSIVKKVINEAQTNKTMNNIATWCAASLEAKGYKLLREASKGLRSEEFVRAPPKYSVVKFLGHGQSWSWLRVVIFLGEESRVVETKLDLKILLV